MSINITNFMKSIQFDHVTDEKATRSHVLFEGNSKAISVLCLTVYQIFDSVALIIASLDIDALTLPGNFGKVTYPYVTDAIYISQSVLCFADQI